MIYLDKNQTDGAAYICEKEILAGGKIALKDVTDGQYLSCDPSNGRLLKQTYVGPWEECRQGSNGIVFDIDWDGRHAYVFAYVEVEG